MIILLNTSTSVCTLSFVNGDWRVDTEWNAGRELAKGLLGFIDTQLSTHGKSWNEVSGLVIYRGPGSFTGLRIGITVFNSIAYANSIPIVGELGHEWQVQGLRRLERGDDDGIVLPEYGSEPNITQPKK